MLQFGVGHPAPCPHIIRQQTEPGGRFRALAGQPCLLGDKQFTSVDYPVVIQPMTSPAQSEDTPRVFALLWMRVRPGQRVFDGQTTRDATIRPTSTAKLAFDQGKTGKHCGIVSYRSRARQDMPYVSALPAAGRDASSPPAACSSVMMTLGDRRRTAARIARETRLALALQGGQLRGHPDLHGAVLTAAREHPEHADATDLQLLGDRVLGQALPIMEPGEAGPQVAIPAFGVCRAGPKGLVSGHAVRFCSRMPVPEMYDNGLAMKTMMQTGRPA